MIVITSAHWPNGVSAEVDKSIINPPVNPKTKDPVRSSSASTIISTAK